jgi:hypothetical protein
MVMTKPKMSKRKEAEQTATSPKAPTKIISKKVMKKDCK